MTSFREAVAKDLQDILALMTDDVLGSTREGLDFEIYRAALERMQSEPHNHLIVGVRGGRIIATYQLTFISGLSLQAARRAQIETVRVASDLRE